MTIHLPCICVRQKQTHRKGGGGGGLEWQVGSCLSVVLLPRRGTYLPETVYNRGRAPTKPILAQIFKISQHLKSVCCLGLCKVFAATSLFLVLALNLSSVQAIFLRNAHGAGAGAGAV